MTTPPGPIRSGAFGHSPHARPGVLRLGHTATDVTTLGPGRRVGVWVAGCPLACRGCLTSDGLVPADSGSDVAVDTLIERLSAVSGHEGVTISGGEPLWQSEALSSLLSGLLARRPGWTVMLYSGWRLEAIRRRGGPTHRALLDRVDLLVDGPFVASRREPSVLWRGSANQRLVPLTAAGRAMIAGRPDRGVGVEVQVREDDLLSIGVPRTADEQALVDRLLTGAAQVRGAAAHRCTPPGNAA